MINTGFVFFFSFNHFIYTNRVVCLGCGMSFVLFIKPKFKLSNTLCHLCLSRCHAYFGNFALSTPVIRACPSTNCSNTFSSEALQSLGPRAEKL